jgi:hypothetical protein
VDALLQTQGAPNLSQHDLVELASFVVVDDPGDDTGAQIVARLRGPHQLVEQSSGSEFDSIES